jgi:hypothetical protein
VLALQIVLAVYAVVMIARYGASALGIFRGERGTRTYVAVFIVVLALAILVVAVKDLAAGLINR